MWLNTARKRPEDLFNTFSFSQSLMWLRAKWYYQCSKENSTLGRQVTLQTYQKSSLQKPLPIVNADSFAIPFFASVTKFLFIWPFYSICTKLWNNTSLESFRFILWHQAETTEVLKLWSTLNFIRLHVNLAQILKSLINTVGLRRLCRELHD